MDQPELMMNLKFDSRECCICYSTPQVIKASLACGHVFCRSCLMRWGVKRNICPTCVREFNRFLYKNDDGQTKMMQLASVPKVDQVPQQRRMQKWIIGINIFCILSLIPLLMLFERHLNFLDESNRDLTIFVTAAIVALCGVRVGHHDANQCQRRYYIGYNPLLLPSVDLFLSSVLLIIHLINFPNSNPLAIQWLNAFHDFLYDNF